MRQHLVHGIQKRGEELEPEMMNKIADGLKYYIRFYDVQSGNFLSCTKFDDSYEQINIGYDSVTKFYSLINDMDHFHSLFTCLKCGKWFLSRRNRDRHFAEDCPIPGDADLEASLGQKELTKITYDRGRYKHKPTIVEKLTTIGIDVADCDRESFIIKNFVTYDSESCLISDLEEIDFNCSTECYSYLNRHRTLMICLCDNIVNETKIIEYNGKDSENIFIDFVEHLLFLQHQYSLLMHQKLDTYFKRINDAILKLQSQGNDYWTKRMKNALADLETHCSVLNVIAFNSRLVRRTYLSFRR